MRIDGNGALVAGGASGLGAATARRLHARGAHVVIADMNDDRGPALADELGERATFVPTDVTDEGSVQGAVDAAAAQPGPLRIAVCCAGIGGSAARVAGRLHLRAQHGLRIGRPENPGHALSIRR